jgi:hypothetical protein
MRRLESRDSAEQLVREILARAAPHDNEIRLSTIAQSALACVAAAADTPPIIPPIGNLKMGKALLDRKLTGTQT